MRILLAFLIGTVCLFTAYTAQGQVSGHRGGLLIIKTDLMSPALDFGAHAGIELVAFRKLAFTFDYRLQNEHLRGNILNLNLMYGTQYNRADKIQAHSFLAGFRFYGSKAMPAPNGPYWGLKMGIARINAQGVVDVTDFNSFFPTTARYNFTFGPVSAFTLEASYGYQWVFLKRLTLDLGFSYSWNFTQNIDDSVIELDEIIPNADEFDFIYLYDYTMRYGGNIINVAPAVEQWTHGFSLNVAIGLLIP